MSKWTHVAGIVRYDAMPEGDKEGVAIAVMNGNPLVLHTVKVLMRPDESELAFANPYDLLSKSKIPTGFEGPIKYAIVENSDKQNLDRYAVTIWGDLRNYDNVEEIFDWFADITLDYVVRSATLLVEVEGETDAHQFTYDYNDGDPCMLDTTIETSSKKIEIKKDMVN
jgi:hypothetical protein